MGPTLDSTEPLGKGCYPQIRRKTLSRLAEVAGKAIPEVLKYLAYKEEARVHCVDGTREQLHAAKIALNKAHSVVIDPVALATLSLLGSEFSFEILPFQVFLTEGTIDEFRGLEDLDDPRRRGYLSLDGERPVYTELDRDNERKLQEARRTFVGLVESHCEIVGGKALAYVEPELRAQMRGALGTATAEAVALASLRRMPLWTDDFVTGVLGAAEAGVRQLWTQAVYLRLHELRLISQEHLDSVTVKLCEWGYKFTSILPTTVVAASKLCDWQPDKEPLRSVLAQFDDEWGERETVLFVLEVLKEIWRSAPMDEPATRVTLRICDLLLAKPLGRRILLAVRTQLDRMFGINVLRARSAKLAIDARLSAPGPFGLFLT